MSRFFAWMHLLVVVGMVAAVGVSRAQLATPVAAGGGGDTQVEADRADVDFKTGVATLTGSVKVSDARMKLAADKVIIHFTAENKLKTIEATGNVVISQPETERQAFAGVAEYDVISGKITLTDEPRLRDGANEMYGAEKIIYFRDSEKVMTEGKGRVSFRLVVPEERGEDMNIFRKDRKDEQE